MDFSFSNRLLALLRQPRKQKAAKPLPRPVRLSLEALEDRLVPSATLAAVKLPPPVAPPPDSFLIDIDSTPVTAGAPFQISVTEVGPNDVPVSNGVSVARIYAGSGANPSYVETISLNYGVGFATLTLNDVGPATIKAVYSVPAPDRTRPRLARCGYGANQHRRQCRRRFEPGLVRLRHRTGRGNNVGGRHMGSVGRHRRQRALELTWVGIDGYGNGTVEQIGTGAKVVNGQTQYFAWWEFFGDQSAQGVNGPDYYWQTLPSSFAVHPGDTISADVAFVSSTSSTSTFLFQITDKTTTGAVESWSQQETTTYVVPTRSSAEWIVENPNGGAQALANFGTETFTGAWATIGSTTGGINSFSNPVALNLSSPSSNFIATVENNPPIASTTAGDF